MVWAWFLFSWWRWQRKQTADANDLEYLDDLLQEHLDGEQDHTKRLEHLINAIEKDHPSSARLSTRSIWPYLTFLMSIGRGS